MVSLSRIFRNTASRLLAVLLLSVCSLCALAQSSTLTAFVDRTDIARNDVITLTIRVDAALGNSRPSLSGINQDFDQVGGIETRSTYTNSGGNVQAWTEYRIALRPKRTGTLTIPAFELNSVTSAPITIRVSDAPDNAAGNDEIFLRTSVSKDSIYVQEELLYTIRIYYSIGFDQGAQLSSPQVDNAVVQQLGSDESFSEVVDGIGYNVTERRFVIYPQSSGELSIPPVYFTATVGRRGLNRFFNNRTQLREINLASDAHLIEVKPRPAGFTGQTWLPASDLDLQEEWSGDLDEVMVGDAITRNIVLTASGLSSSLLPGIEYDELSGLRFYPDQPVREDSASRSGVVGTRREGTAIVASRPGQYTLPEVRLPWWNTTSDELEVAVLPARTITVLPATDENGSTLQPENQVPGVGAANTVSAASGSSQPAGNTTLWMSTTFVFAAAWLLTLMLWLQSRKQVKAGVYENDPGSPSAAARPARDKSGKVQQTLPPKAGAALKQLKNACDSGNLPAVRRALLQWGQAILDKPGIGTLSQLGAACGNEEFSLMCAELDAALYSPEGHDYDCRQLYAKVSDLHKQGPGEQNGKDKYALRPLYRI